jgi:peptidoglycan/LPS O-acetylase OafA/YrhL
VWTLSTEWQFYLAWPFLLLVAAKMRLRRRTMLALVGTAIVADWIARLCGHGALRVDGLLLGACVALVKDHPMVRHQIHRIAEPAFVVCTAVIVLLTFHAVPLAATQDPTIVAAAAALLVLVVCTGPTRMMDVALGNGVFRYFGKISYGLYLYHFPVVGAMYLGGFTGPKMLVAGMLVAIPLADFSFRFIESPIMKMRAKQKETFIESKAEVRS